MARPHPPRGSIPVLGLFLDGPFLHGPSGQRKQPKSTTRTRGTPTGPWAQKKPPEPMKQAAALKIALNQRSARRKAKPVTRPPRRGVLRRTSLQPSDRGREPDRNEVLVQREEH